ncbi:MarR family transcriptional regulator [Streptomyces fumanus]|uniref:Uncharacterized protein n=1 Tax=Streptomyces fumanus TaxID=67302 RepID=A0A919AEF3_9ACTN|nr:MarR family transcriptional regulator [Streptomyces fumanus]GHE98164.1 hypothetical protein GCM10018772_23210 [Streptomyces fumanus]
MLPDATAFDALHLLALKGTAPADLLAAGLRLGAEDARAELEKLRADGLATHVERRGLWRVTPEGRQRHAALLDEDLTGGARDRLRPGYERFLPVNDRFKELCTRWQLRDGTANDHTDPGYDAARVAELGAVHEETTPIVAELAAVRPRFARYADRLTGALDRLRGGETKAFTGVLCDSYHDVWMELHRDLLLCLRIEREAEERARGAR